MTLRAIILIGILGIIGLLTSAQEAKVILLTPSDATETQIAYTNLTKAQAAWDKAQSIIKERYLRVGYNDPEAGSEIVESWGNAITGNLLISDGSGGVTWNPLNSTSPPSKEEEAKRQAEREEHRKHAKYERKGWSGGFEFSSDFRFIVPKHVDFNPNKWSNGCIIAN